VKKENAARRKREQRAKQKENGASEVSASPVVIGYGKNTPVLESRQAPIQKTSPAMFSPAPLSLGQRGALGSLTPGWDWDAITKRVDRISGPFGFLYL